MSKVRVRFAPSPTGSLHIGGLRTALFNYLIARSLKGELILRIEDTDQKREIRGATEKLIEIFHWLGIKFDEGPHVGGRFGPYLQSERMHLYERNVNKLLARGEAYRCFCSPERLKKMRARQEAKKLPPRYDRACRDLRKEEVEKMLADGRPYVIRQKMPIEGEIRVYDELRGEIKFRAEDLEDHILIKSDDRPGGKIGLPTYQFASVVDDHLMKISHVVRGEEWLPSFPKNILLYKSFGWPTPKFIHLPLTLNKGGGKLSKRQGDVAVEDFRAAGYLPAALLNFSALLGWHPGDEKEIFTLKEAIKNFKIKDLGVSPAIFDTEKLDYLNGYYIRQLKINQLVELCKPYLEKYTERGYKTGFIKKIVGLEQERLKKISEIGELTEFFFTDKLNYHPELLIWKKMSKAEVKNNLEQVYGQLKKIPEKNWTDDSLEDALITYIKAKNAKVGTFLWPLRAALTGRQASPGPFAVAEILGKGKSLKRIKEGVGKLNAIKIK